MLNNCCIIVINAVFVPSHIRGILHTAGPFKWTAKMVIYSSDQFWNILCFIIFNLQCVEIVNGHVIGQPSNTGTDQKSAKSCHSLAAEVDRPKCTSKSTAKTMKLWLSCTTQTQRAQPRIKVHWGTDISKLLPVFVKLKVSYPSHTKHQYIRQI